MDYICNKQGKGNGRNAIVNRTNTGIFQVDFHGANGSVIVQQPEHFDIKIDAIEAAEGFVAGTMTNVEKVVMLMEWGCPTGPMIQPFVMTAIEKYAEQVVKAGAIRVDTSLIDGAAWVATAKWAKEELTKE